MILSVFNRPPLSLVSKPANRMFVNLPDESFFSSLSRLVIKVSGEKINLAHEKIYTLCKLGILSSYYYEKEGDNYI